MTLKRMLEEKAKRYASKSATVFPEQRLSYLELDEDSNRLANSLLRLGVVKGDRVALLLSNRPEFPVSYFGIIKAGGIVVPLDARLKADELSFFFENSQPKVLIAESPLSEALKPLMPRFPSLEHLIDLGEKSVDPFPSYQELIAESPPQSPRVELEAEDICHISYTSGTTGRPKGIMRTHRGMLVGIDIQAQVLQQKEDEIAILFGLPLSHGAGLENLLIILGLGGTGVVVSGADFGQMLKVIEREKITYLVGMPPLYTAMMNLPEVASYDLSSLRLCTCGGAPLAGELLKRFKQRYGRDIIQVWVMSETAVFPTCQPLDGRGKLGSAGRVCPGWELKIVDDEGRELPPDQAGEIAIRGEAVTKGYYNNPVATANAIRDGWLYTGDIGRRDEDGYVFIHGRREELIAVGGQNVFPGDIEEVLYTYPKVAEVAVVGTPDGLQGEAVKAVIVLKEGERTTEEEIKDFCRGRLAEHEVPRVVEFRLNLPKTLSGKINKQGL
jgi:acyl-CoA synthetase (AMP-forming)/AMP-acid ligase II